MNHSKAPSQNFTMQAIVALTILFAACNIVAAQTKIGTGLTVNSNPLSASIPLLAASSGNNPTQKCTCPPQPVCNCPNIQLVQQILLVVSITCPSAYGYLLASIPYLSTILPSTSSQVSSNILTPVGPLVNNVGGFLGGAIPISSILSTTGLENILQGNNAQPSSSGLLSGVLSSLGL